MISLILFTAARFLMPLLLLFSLFLLLRGHHEPGGGFAGGLVAAAAFAVYMISTDARSTRHVVGVDPRTFIGAGLLVALGSGVVSILLGQPFLTGQWWDIPVPGGAKLSFGTPLFFDIGVYFVVLGVTVTIILSLGEES